MGRDFRMGQEILSEASAGHRHNSEGWFALVAMRGAD